MKFLNKLSTQSYNFFVKQENLIEYGKILLDVIVIIICIRPLLF